jgi:formate dehydrogenase subunit delta
MTSDADGRLIYMANQIARNFEALGHDNAAAATADHILAFWDPRMKAHIFLLGADRTSGLGPIAAAAVAQLRAGAEPAPQTRATRFAAVDEHGSSDAG